MLVGSPPPMHVLAALCGLCGKEGGKGGDEIGEKRRKRHEIGREACVGIEKGTEGRGGEKGGEKIGLIKMHMCTYKILNK